MKKRRFWRIYPKVKVDSTILNSDKGKKRPMVGTKT